MTHAGAVHMDTNEEFEDIYGNYTHDKLKGQPNSSSNKSFETRARY